MRKIAGGSLDPLPVVEKNFHSKSIGRIEFSPTRRGFLGVLAVDDNTSEIHVLENHTADNDQSGNSPMSKLSNRKGRHDYDDNKEEDIIFTQLEFAGIDQKYDSLEVTPTSVIKQKESCISDFCWSSIKDEDAAVITISRGERNSDNKHVTPNLHYVSEIPALTEHSGMIITDKLIMVGHESHINIYSCS